MTSEPALHECDCCGDMSPDCESLYAYGVETLACAACRSADAPANDAFFDFKVRELRGLED